MDLYSPDRGEAEAEAELRSADCAGELLWQPAGQGGGEGGGEVVVVCDGGGL